MDSFKVNTLFKNLPQWIYSTGRDQDIVLCTRMSLQRNSEEFPFPHIFRSADLPNFLARCHRAAQELFSTFKSMSDLNSQEHSGILMEQQFITGTKVGREIHVSTRDNTALLVNAEDHFSIVNIEAGYNMSAQLLRLRALDETLEKHFSYAVSMDWGYLRSQFSKLGSGLHADVYLHLPAFGSQDGFKDSVLRLQKNACTIHGFGNKKYPLGNLFRLSADAPLGSDEEKFLQSIDLIVQEIVHIERREREALVQSGGTPFLDTIWRDFGILQYARQIGLREAFTRFSSVRLGGCLNILPSNTIPLLFFVNQPNLLNLAHKTLFAELPAGNPQPGAELPAEKPVTVADLTPGKLETIAEIPVGNLTLGEVILGRKPIAGAELPNTNPKLEKEKRANVFRTLLNTNPHNVG